MKSKFKIEIRGKKFFVCEYTGALIQNRYFYEQEGQKVGTFVTLPVMLRFLHDNVDIKEFARLKKQIEQQYFQPNIPIQPHLPVDKIPLDDMALFTYLESIEKGSAWLQVAGGESAQ